MINTEGIEIETCNTLGLGHNGIFTDGSIKTMEGLRHEALDRVRTLGKG